LEADRLPRTTRAWLQLVHPRNRALLRANAVEAGRTRQRTDVEYRPQRADGALVHVLQTIEPLAVEPGSP
jgi:hypothetical protein